MEYVIALGLLSFVGVFVWIRFFKSSKYLPKPTIQDELKAADKAKK